MPNYNEATGLPYGCISVSKLADDVGQALYLLALDASEREARKRGDVGEDEDFEIEEPSAMVTLDGVTGWMFYLGGAPIFLSVDGPKSTARAWCSPCVPGAADLDSGEGSIDCHGVPADWMARA